jgi:hypothetical protein
VAACGQATSQATPDLDQMPKTPLTLPLVDADLDFTGTVSAHVSRVRLFDCRAYQAGISDFFRSTVLFQIGPRYRLTALTNGPRVRPYPTPTSSSHSGPGAYRGMVDLDEQLVGPGGMALGDHSWVNREVGSITVAVSPKTVRLGAVIDPPPLKIAPVTLLDEITLEPRVPGSAGVGLTPAQSARTSTFVGNGAALDDPIGQPSPPISLVRVARPDQLTQLWQFDASAGT